MKSYPKKPIPFNDPKQLDNGDIVRHKNGDAWTVISTYPEVVAIRTTHISNPSEWLGYFPGAEKLSKENK